MLKLVVLTSVMVKNVALLVSLVSFDSISVGTTLVPFTNSKSLPASPKITFDFARATSKDNEVVVSSATSYFEEPLSPKSKEVVTDWTALYDCGCSLYGTTYGKIASC